MIRTIINAQPRAVPSAGDWRRYGASAILLVATLPLALAALRAQEAVTAVDVPPLAGVGLSTTRPVVGEVVRLQATYTNTSTARQEVRLRLFGSVRSFQALGSVPPPLTSVAPGGRLAREIAFLVEQPGPFGGDVVVTDTGFVKWAEAPFPMLTVRRSPLPIVLGGVALTALVIPVAALLLLPALCYPPSGRRACVQGRQSPQSVRTPLMSRLALGVAVLTVALAALSPVLLRTPARPLPLLLAFPAEIILLPALAVVGGRAIRPRWAAVGVGATLGLLLTLAATGGPLAALAAIVCGCLAFSGEAMWQGKSRDALIAAIASAVPLGLLAFNGWEMYREQAIAIIAGAGGGG